jgi:hypothetical protein
MVEPENISGTGKMLGRRLSENELDWILILSNVIFRDIRCCVRTDTTDTLDLFIQTELREL